MYYIGCKIRNEFFIIQYNLTIVLFTILIIFRCIINISNTQKITSKIKIPQRCRVFLGQAAMGLVQRLRRFTSSHAVCNRRSRATQASLWCRKTTAGDNNLLAINHFQDHASKYARSFRILRPI